MSINFEIICRLCMKYSNSMISLFHSKCTLPHKIMMLIPTLKVYAGDNLPTQVCQECADQINSFDSFKLVCESSNVTLIEYLQTQKPEKLIGEKCEDWEISSDIATSDVSFSQDHTDKRKTIKNLHENEEKDENKFFTHVKEESVSQECNYELKLEPEIEISVLEKSEFRDESLTKSSSIDEKKSSVTSTSKNIGVPCNICNKFVVKKRIKEHARRHVGARPYKCDICSKTFSERYYLKKHALVHSGLKVHMCDVCGKGFKLLNHLKSHHLTHTGQKLRVCDICGKGFNQIGSFRNHELLHTGEKPFGCDICGNRYSQKNSLKIHLAVHTGQRQHFCELCGKGFILKGHLRTHLGTHTGERKFSCEICGLSYSQRHSLKKHKTKHLT